MCKIDSSHQRVLTMILKNPTLVMVRIENKVDASFAKKKKKKKTRITGDKEILDNSVDRSCS